MNLRAPQTVALPWAPSRWMTPVAPHPSAAASLLRDAPDIAAEDRVEVDLENLVSVAVALDVITTWTKSHAAHPSIVATLCATLHRFAAVGGIAPDTEALLQLAASAAGTARSFLARRLSHTVAQHDASRDLAAPLCTPASVAFAVRSLETAADLLIREATLRLAAKDVLDYHQI